MIRIGIVNPLTLVGSELKQILNERGFPYTHLSLLDSTGKDEGALTDNADTAAIVTEISDDELEDLDLVFFCGAPQDVREWIGKRDELGFIAIDLTQPSASASEGVIAVAGVNHGNLGEANLLISPQPIAVALAVIIDALRQRHRVATCAASVIQPASEFGQRGIDELYQQTIGSLNMQAIPKDVFDRQLAFNMYPALGAEVLEGHVRQQVHAAAGDDFELAVSVTQGTLFHGHMLSLFVRLDTESTMSAADIASTLGARETILVAGSTDDWSTIEAAGKDQILIARVAAEPEIPGGYTLWCVADNLRRTSALNAALIAEELLPRLGLGPN